MKKLKLHFGWKLIQHRLNFLDSETGTTDAGGDASENSIVSNEVTTPNNENDDNVENDEDVSQ